MDSSDQPANRVPSAGRPVRQGREPMLSPSPEVLLRYNARVLDPTTAWRRFPDEVIRPTVYVGNRMLLRNVLPGSGPFAALQDAAAQHGLSIEPVAADQRHAEALRRAGTYDRDDAVYPQRVELRPLTSPAVPADAWPVLQSYRSLVGDSQVPQDVALEHLLTATSGPGIGGLPFTEGHGVGGVPFTEGHGVGPAYQYGMPGWGGRTPVNWIGGLPVRRAHLAGRRPVVAVLDTGVGAHPWLHADIVRRNPTVDGTPAGHPLGLTDPATDPEQTGVLIDIYEGVLDSDAGHGTFIAGIIRQLCPDADVLAIRAMASDGVVAEGDLLNSLRALLQRQALAQAGRPDLAIDVVSLSLGYYHEQPDDAAFDPMLLGPLSELGARGVAVVASAGNDATARKMFPAAFTPYPGGIVSKPDPHVVPLVSVGALNPNWRTVALFSNGGPWVRCYRPGASIVSTVPTTFNASAQPSAVVDLPDEGLRATIDEDDFSGGFATWSGTSFAAPYLAGEIAAAILSGKFGAMDPVDPGAAVARSWGALGHLIGMQP